jgi:hypothetical protein
MVVYDRLIKKDKYVEIKGKGMLTYRTHNTNSILFKPDVYSSKVITVLGPEKLGGDSIITYPDGSTVTDTEEPDYPDFEKLESIK